MSLECRELGADDGHQVAERMAQLDPWLRLGIKAEPLTQYLAREDLALHRYGLFWQGQLAGAIAIRAPWLRGPYLELLVIFPGFQQQGLGRQAVTWAMATFASHNFWACVSAFNRSARAFYGRLGFEEVGTLLNLVKQGEDEILLRKIIQSP